MLASRVRMRRNASGSEAVQDGYWVHKDTNAVTYFGADVDFITDGIMGYPSWMPNCSEVKLPSGVTGFKTYNWVFEELDNMEVAYIGFVHSKETLPTGNDVLIDVDLSNTSITSMGRFCFYYCNSLTSITLPESITSLGDSCFSECYALTSITLPESITSLGEYCFSSCTSLTSITIPEGVTSIGEGCFYYCNSLTSITLPESVVSIENNCFQNCSSLTSIILPESLTSLGSDCFGNCISLTSIILPESLTSLGSDCFGNCISLTSITLPESVVSIESGCFYGCESLTLATVLPATPPSLGDAVFGSVHTSFNIKVRYPYVNTYKTATNWSAYASKISAI